MLEYIGAWTYEEVEDWDVTITEGAEQGMVQLRAAKTLEIAQTTCNRNIYVFVQAPAYKVIAIHIRSVLQMTTLASFTIAWICRSSVL